MSEKQEENSGIGELGAFIRQQRERSKMSLRRLADRAGISNPYLSQIERGLRKPSAEILKSLARELSIQAESMYVRAGLLDEGFAPPTVVEAVEADPTLSIRHKQVLLDLYRTLIEAGGIEPDNKETP
ncbi:MAG: helix-turn-helix domain-containing protein [Acidimicrobiia bacterium]|nr:helix-turn-helix domain-containing protein [Acidimicrobiia bacterium]